MERKQTSTIAWIALIISILAVILAWTAFNRAGADLEEIVQMEVEQAVMEIEESYQQAEEAARDGATNTLEVGADAMTETADVLDAGAANTNEAAADVQN